MEGQWFHTGKTPHPRSSLAAGASAPVPGLRGIPPPCSHSAFPRRRCEGGLGQCSHILSLLLSFSFPPAVDEPGREEAPSRLRSDNLSSGVLDRLWRLTDPTAFVAERSPSSCPGTRKHTRKLHWQVGDIHGGMQIKGMTELDLTHKILRCPQLTL